MILGILVYTASDCAIRFRPKARLLAACAWNPWGGFWIALALSLANEQLIRNSNRLGESDSLIKTKQSDGVNTCRRFVISAQCSEC